MEQEIKEIDELIAKFEKDLNKIIYKLERNKETSSMTNALIIELINLKEMVDNSAQYITMLKMYKKNLMAE